MSLRSLFLLILGAIIVTFIAVNWSAMTAPAHLNLLFTEVDAPLGVVLLVRADAPDPVRDLREYAEAFRPLIDKTGLVVGITHAEAQNPRSLMLVSRVRILTYASRIFSDCTTVKSALNTPGVSTK